MRKKKEDAFEQIKDIFEEEYEYNPTDEELLDTLANPQKGEDTNPEMQAQFVAKLFDRMHDSPEFKQQVVEAINKRMQERKK